MLIHKLEKTDFDVVSKYMTQVNFFTRYKINNIEGYFYGDSYMSEMDKLIEEYADNLIDNGCCTITEDNEEYLNYLKATADCF